MPNGAVHPGIVPKLDDALDELGLMHGGEGAFGYRDRGVMDSSIREYSARQIRGLLVSVRKLLELMESSVIQEWWPDSGEVTVKHAARVWSEPLVVSASPGLPAEPPAGACDGAEAFALGGPTERNRTGVGPIKI
jgi:hypothetical protein